ncbi:hypothetical protein VTP01DRAFT_3215 [Rhizomucor pusillus]|uniref:uncharacterized protein n=1 Tax=Rhizomucor pusillus TaxID=4840 RepID=UPI0037438CB5
MSAKKCCKCKTSDATVLIRHAYYCQPCFVYAAVGKYRSIINKSRSIARTKGRVLLACSGGPCSIAMIHLTREFMHVAPHEKKKVQLMTGATVCHIDESALFKEQVNTVDSLKKMMDEEYSHMNFISVPMEEIYSPEFLNNSGFSNTLEAAGGSDDYEYLVNIKQQAPTTSEDERKERLQKLFADIRKASAKEDLYWHIKMAMLVTIAKKERCSYIFMADSSTRQSIKMISMTSKGRGYSIPLDVGVENDITFAPIAILRPMKDMLSKEVGLYNRFIGLEKYVVAPTSFSTKMPAKHSIERLTEDFIVSLERDFPSTVSTISRTASKLTPSNDIDLSRRCAVCLMPYQPNIEDWRRRITVTGVQAESANGTVAAAAKSCSNNNINGCCGGSEDCGKGTVTVDVNQYLCYSCQVDLKDYGIDAISLLPPYISSDIFQRSREESLRDQIKEFLIDDNDEE